MLTIAYIKAVSVRGGTRTNAAATKSTFHIRRHGSDAVSSRREWEKTLVDGAHVYTQGVENHSRSQHI